MRNIKFDESIVMNELVKIAQQNGIFKIAVDLNAYVNLKNALDGKKFDIKQVGLEWANYCDSLAQSTKNAQEYTAQVKQLAAQLQSKANLPADKLVSVSGKFVGAQWPEADKQQRATQASKNSNITKTANGSQVGSMFLDLLLKELHGAGVAAKPTEASIYNEILNKLKEVLAVDGFHAMMKKAYEFNKDSNFMKAVNAVFNHPEFMHMVEGLGKTKTATDHENMKKRVNKMFDAKGLDQKERMEEWKDVGNVLKNLQIFETPPKAKFEILDNENKNDVFNKMKEEKELRLKKQPSLYCPWCEKGALEEGIATCPGCEHKMNKKANYDVYDVGGETAEDLVESAHGNLKGTETELTIKPEDDGGLIETIVERQKNDKEVAEKEPTGVYAHLCNLSLQLKKAGLNKYAMKVDALVPYEEVVKHKLQTLASDLQASGYAKYAKTLLQLLDMTKTASTSYDAGAMFLDLLSKDLQSGLSGKPIYAPILDELHRTLDGQGFHAMIQKAYSYNSDPHLANSIKSVMNNASFMSAVESLQKPKNQTSSSPVTLPNPEEVKIGLTKEMIAKFQKNWNSYIVDPFMEHYPQMIERLSVDGIMGPHTKQAMDLCGGYTFDDVVRESKLLNKRLSEKLNPQPKV